MNLKKVKDNIQEAVKRAGGQVTLASHVGIKQSQISDYLTGKTLIENMTLGTFVKLFPELEVKYFKDTPDRPDETGSIERQVISILRTLSTDDQARCLAVIAANFGENIRKKTK